MFAHGDDAREIETMVAWGMPIVDALRSATSIDARVLHMEERFGRVKTGLFADLIAVEGDPTRDIHDSSGAVRDERCRPLQATLRLTQTSNDGRLKSRP
ncbi:MAG TPA: amidohydrolase family protein [Pyrinomonadaceae bacterium]|nr:amidohydrolase family protein [Pyrinomonadaceae bacterium]